jgi:hypothetical protein
MFKMITLLAVIAASGIGFAASHASASTRDSYECNNLRFLAGASDSQSSRGYAHALIGCGN